MSPRIRVAAKDGFNLVELLVCIAIISILMALSLPTFSRAIRKAKSVSTQESMRQGHIGEMSEGGQAPKVAPGRQKCRDAFRMKYDTGDGEELVTKVLYVIKSDAEFRAYYYTMVDPLATDPLEILGGLLVATDPESNRFFLPPIYEAHDAASKHGRSPVAWTYFSTVLTDTTTGTLGVDVIHSDGHTTYVKFPGDYPATQTVAELSHDFVVKSGGE